MGSGLFWVYYFVFFKQKTAYEMRISDWSSDVCSSDLVTGVTVGLLAIGLVAAGFGTMAFLRNTLVANLDEQLRLLAASDIADTVFKIGRASCRERVCQYV